MRSRKYDLFVCGLALILSQRANAQTAVERNLPPAPVASAAPIVEPNAVAASQDATPLGANVRAIVLLADGDQSFVNSQVSDGVHLSRISQLDRARTRKLLGRFIGRPLSRKLIAEIEVEVARQSRAVHRPFVSLSTPEQEITGGVIQIRVTEFRTGKIEVQGVAGNRAASIRKRIRLNSGETVDSAVLSEDLDWLNRNPFRQASALFAPASAQGETDLTIAIKPQRPFRVYGGWSNTGSQSTGLDRFFVGAVVPVPGLTDAYASYQLTGSSDFWKDDGTVFKGQPRYRAQGGRIYVPTFSRQNIELTVSDALTNQVVNADFDVRQRTTEVTLGYRSALSELGLPAGSGDILIAVEGKRQRREVFFGGESVLKVSADIVQGLIGWSKGWQGNGKLASASVNLHVSPGGISDRSSGARLAELTNGRITSDRYAYLNVDLSASTRLSRNFALTSQLSAQYAGEALPLAAQIGLGGDGLVRGYTPDDGSFDASVVSRTELRVPVFSVLGRKGSVRDQLSPFVFLDAGYGRDQALKTNTTLVSAGVGADYSFGRFFSAGLNSAWALKDGQRTDRGDWRVQARATVTF
jgi:hemolysin activation/secretion protein